MDFFKYVRYTLITNSHDNMGLVDENSELNLKGGPRTHNACFYITDLQLLML